MILGLPRRGTPADGPFDHLTGRGHVAAHTGDYHDAIYNKHNFVVPLVTETFGGLGRRAQAMLRKAARVARGCGKLHRAHDRTRYPRHHRISYHPHHLARISSAIVMGTADAMLVQARVRALEPIPVPQ